MKTITNITYPAFALFAFACFALAPQAQAICQQGCLGAQNTVLGDDALLNNTGSENTAIGAGALESNTGGLENTAIGTGALESNTLGLRNTATGALALETNTGDNNTATGFTALLNNTNGSGNTADGEGALDENTTGAFNTADGWEALFGNSTGNYNTATGAGALGETTGSNNIALGFAAGAYLTTGDNNIYIGNVGGGAESNKIRIGTRGTQRGTFIAGISGATVPTGVAVIIDANGHLGTTTSSMRFKDEIRPMDKASEAILALKPVTFRYKKEIDAERTPQFGLVAEQVEKVNPDLVARDEQGKPYTVRYDAVNAMLLNEFLKEHRKVEEQSRKIQEQDATITQFKKEMKTIAARLKEQDSKIQKVSARLEMQTTPAQTVASSK